MFELENEISSWKQAVVSNGAVSSEAMLELESHLRESVASLMNKGLSAQEAFFVGTDRLGHPLALQKEYAKNDLGASWKLRAFWMLAGYIGIKVVASVVSVIGTTTWAAMALGGFGGSVSGVAMISLMAIAWCCFFMTIFRARRRLAHSSEALRSKWIVAIGLLLLLAPVINMIWRIAAVRVVEKDWYGDAAMCLSVGGVALNFCVLTLCFVALYKLNSNRAAWNLQ